MKNKNEGTNAGHIFGSTRGGVTKLPALPFPFDLALVRNNSQYSRGIDEMFPVIAECSLFFRTASRPQAHQIINQEFRSCIKLIMGCSSSKLDHLSDSIHTMLSHETRTKAGTGTYKKALRRGSTGTHFDSMTEELAEESRHSGRPVNVSKLPAYSQ